MTTLISRAIGWGRIGQVACGAVVWLACAAGGFGGELAWFGGTYTGWPTTWTALDGLNDPADYTPGKLDFVGNDQAPGAYWAQDSSYVYFRVRMNVASVNDKTYSDTVHILIDRRDYGQEGGLPDYGFSWDSNQIITNHGLEMTVLATSTATTWGSVEMDDIDGSSGQKLTRDINGGGRTGDGYIRTIDGQTTADLGTTTFIDFAISWDYLTDPLKGDTELGPSQTWKIALATIANATDHNPINADVAGGALLTSSVTAGWSAPIQTQSVPEPSSIALLGLVAVVGYAGRRLRRRRHGTKDATDAAQIAL